MSNVVLFFYSIITVFLIFYKIFIIDLTIY